MKFFLAVFTMIGLEQWRVRIAGSSGILYNIVFHKMNRRRVYHHLWSFGEIMALMMIIGILKLCLDNYEKVWIFFVWKLKLANWAISYHLFSKFPGIMQLIFYEIGFVDEQCKSRSWRSEVAHCTSSCNKLLAGN